METIKTALVVKGLSFVGLYKDGSDYQWNPSFFHGPSLHTREHVGFKLTLGKIREHGRGGEYGCKEFRVLGPHRSSDDFEKALFEAVVAASVEWAAERGLKLSESEKA